MAAKEVRFSDDARSSMVRGVNIRPQPSRRAGTQGRNAPVLERAAAPRRSPRTCFGREANRTQGQSRTWGAQMVKEVAFNTSDEAGDGNTTARARAGDHREGSRTWPPAQIRWNQARYRQGRHAASEEIKKLPRPWQGHQGDCAGRPEFRNPTRHRKTIAEAMEKSAKEGVITVEAGSSRQNERKSSRHAVRSGLPLAVFHQHQAKPVRRARKAIYLWSTADLGTSRAAAVGEAVAKAGVRPMVERRGRRGEALAPLVVKTSAASQGGPRQGPGWR